MAVTLTEAEKYTTNMVKRGVLREIIKDSVVLQKLPFIEITGNAYQYLRETTLPTAAFYNPGEIWTENTGDATQRTASIKILGGDADTDNFVQATRSDKTDVRAEAIQQKAKAVKHTFLDCFYYGDTATNAKSFDGLHKIFLGSDMAAQDVNEGSSATGSPFNATNFDLALDMVLDGKPDCFITTRAIRRRIHQYLRSKANVDYAPSEYGLDPSMPKTGLSWGGVPIYADDFLTQTETIASGIYSAKTGGVTGTVFGVRFGSNDLLGLQNGSLETKAMGQVDNKDAMRHRIKWYVSIALMRAISAVKIDGITDAVMVD